MNKIVSNIIIIVTLLLVVGVGGRYVYTKYPMLFGISPVEEPASAPQYTGSLIMTLKPSIPENSAAAIYVVSAANASLKKLDESHDFYASSFSSDGRIAVVENMASSSWQLVIAKISDRDTQMIVVPPAPALFPGASSWSPDNKLIVYEAVTALPAADDTNIENVRVVLLDTTTGMQKILDTGADPLFMKDGSVLYIKKDGVYRIDRNGLLATSSAESATRAAYFNGLVATRNTRVALSHTNETLLVAMPDENGVITFHAIVGSDGVFGEVSKNIGLVLFPVFSPNDRSVAFIQQQKDGEGHTTKALVIEDLDTQKIQTVLKLDGYTNDFLSLSAWVK